MGSYDWGNDLVRWAWWARQGSDQALVVVSVGAPERRLDAPAD
jgi:hypothetical protein